MQLEMGLQHQRALLWVGSPQKRVTPESSLPSGLSVLPGTEPIASDHEWKPLCPRKGISSGFCEMEFSRNPLEGLDWDGRLQFRSDFIFPKRLRWDPCRELEVFSSKSAFICKILILYFVTFKLLSLMF